MSRYAINRLLQTIIVLIGVTLLTFIMVNVAPGDPVAVMMEKKADADTIERIREQMGLNDSYPKQYIRFVKNAVKGDFGQSYFQKLPIKTLMARGFKVTGTLALFVLVFSIIFGLVMGLLAAVFRGKILDRIIMLISTLGMAMPSFFLAMILQLVFGLKLKLLPISGINTPGSYILPTISLGVIYGASIARLTRTNMLDALNQDYIRTARAKGVRERKIVLIHGLKNAAIPILTYMGTLIKSILGGSVLVETVFAINGIGTLLVEGIMKRDIPVIQGCTVYIAVVFVIANLIIDLAYGFIDPRVRVSTGE
ncbi:ABC transporter permease [Peptoniphilus catoniae]|uniref:ABC transporter permease n=1 Tax=Peptoniphilus catoniae TaxID=1660341 RepID=UPI001C58874E|nr:ABC transporter permease [Peptoniphilus catoniae]